MLVLTRKKNDSIVIDGRIFVEVLQIKGNGIRLGISAPPDVSILRGELKPFGVAGQDEPSHPNQRQQTLSFYSEPLSEADSDESSQPNRQPLDRFTKRPSLDRPSRLPNTDRPWGLR